LHLPRALVRNRVVIADDVVRASVLARETLAGAAHLDWRVPAGKLAWSCWETVEHLSDSLFAYAAQLTPAHPATTTHVPFGWHVRREGGPYLTVFVNPADGADGLLQVFESCTGMFAAVLAAVPPDRLSFHPYGVADAGGFAAMGVVEILVHVHDVAVGLGLPWSPPADLCSGALARLFREVPPDAEPWPALLWVTGRADLPGRPAPVDWKWDGTPRR
jgi:hypothetical protein